MDLLEFLNPGFLWHACPGKFSTCDSEGPRAWLEAASARRPDGALMRFAPGISLLLRSSQDCDVP